MPASHRMTQPGERSVLFAPHFNSPLQVSYQTIVAHAKLMETVMCVTFYRHL
jgi:hypothetical protein